MGGMQTGQDQALDALPHAPGVKIVVKMFLCFSQPLLGPFDAPLQVSPGLTVACHLI